MKPETKEGIDRYVQYGIRPGGFLTAVLENNLMGAMERADSENRIDLFEICRYIYNHCPILCHGSPEIVNEWITHFKKDENNEQARMEGDHTL